MTLVTDTYHFFSKDITASQFTDAGYRKMKRIERFKSLDLSKLEIQKVWAAHKNNFQVEEQMDNITEVKLTFPIDKNAIWDGNAVNSFEPENYQYKQNKIDTIINEVSLNQTQKVDHFFRSDPFQINTEIRFEYYALNIGLVNKHEIFVKRFTPGVLGENAVNSGYTLSIRIKSYKID